MTTTIKVPVELRERVQAYAVARTETQAAVLSHALDLLDRETFFKRLAADIAREPEDAADAAEREAWLSGPAVAGEAPPS